ncbi:MAG: Nif3-like dinuclear metal center hexameric protein, partial [Clostridia bacterium]|nr:Nif3-like dinuclear metal center hexameric protein [Clostridia bacterium]
MTIRELYARLNERIPRELSCTWDNDGLMCCPDGSREVKRVLVALDATGAVV